MTGHMCSEHTEHVNAAVMCFRLWTRGNACKHILTLILHPKCQQQRVPVVQENLLYDSPHIIILGLPHFTNTLQHTSVQQQRASETWRVAAQELFKGRLPPWKRNKKKRVA